MRTTVTIDDTLLSGARELAARTSRSLGDVVDDALRLLLADRQSPVRPESVDLPVFGGSGLRPGVDPADKDALAELLDGTGRGDPAGERGAGDIVPGGSHAAR